jgi:hypothetical protein
MPFTPARRTPQDRRNMQLLDPRRGRPLYLLSHLRSIGPEMVIFRATAVEVDVDSTLPLGPSGSGKPSRRTGPNSWCGAARPCAARSMPPLVRRHPPPRMARGARAPHALRRSMRLTGLAERLTTPARRRGRSLAKATPGLHSPQPRPKPQSSRRRSLPACPRRQRRLHSRTTPRGVVSAMRRGLLVPAPVPPRPSCAAPSSAQRCRRSSRSQTSRRTATRTARMRRTPPHWPAWRSRAMVETRR